MNLLEKYKPAVRKRTLLLVAGCVWTLAGGILIARALVQLLRFDHHLGWEILAGMVLGIGFYAILFARISRKHINRITLIRVDNPCFFSFFNFRSYLLMSIMITAGVTFRKLNLVNPEYLYTFYLAMGLPLLISAYRFYYSWFKNKDLV
ncbi:MAG TPA: hypothetical protein VMC08_02015 [Bacteroidales bacterium]|nr:hypothetical protein [Bacteroidales bacterium]